MTEVVWVIVGAVLLIELGLALFQPVKKEAFRGILFFYPLIAILVLLIQYYGEWFRLSSLGLLILGFIEIKQSFGKGSKSATAGSMVFKIYGLYFLLGIGLSRFTQFPFELILFLLTVSFSFDRLNSALLSFFQKEHTSQLLFNPIASSLALIGAVGVAYYLNGYLLFPFVKLTLTLFFCLAFASIGRILLFRLRRELGAKRVGTIFTQQGGIVDALYFLFATGGFMGILHFLYPELIF